MNNNWKDEQFALDECVAEIASLRSQLKKEEEERDELSGIARRVITFVRCRKEEGLNCRHCKARREMRLWLEARK